MINKTNTNIWKEHLFEYPSLLMVENPEKENRPPFKLVQEEVNQQFDELLESRDKFLDELDNFTRMLESLYEISKDFTYEDLLTKEETQFKKINLDSVVDIKDEEKILLRSLTSRPDLWNSREGHMGWKDFVNKIKDFTDHSLNTDYRVFLEDNKLSGKYGWDFTEKGGNN